MIYKSQLVGNLYISSKWERVAEKVGENAERANVKKSKEKLQSTGLPLV